MNVRHGEAIVELDAGGKGDRLIGHFALHMVSCALWAQRQRRSWECTKERTVLADGDIVRCSIKLDVGL